MVLSPQRDIIKGLSNKIANKEERSLVNQAQLSLRWSHQIFTLDFYLDDVYVVVFLFEKV